MKKKDLENEELDEIIDDEAEIIDDEAEDVVIDDEIIEDEAEEAPKSKKAKKAKKTKPGKKPMKKGAKIAIITSSSVVAVAAIVLVVVFVILPLFNSAGGKIDFAKNNITGYETNPASASSSSKILKALTYDEDYMADLYSSSSDTNLIAAQMMFAAYKNIATAYQYSYFSDKIGTTNLGDKSGKLVVQRLRRQNKDIKDDITLKLPIEHNFGTFEVKAVTGEGAVAMRYIKNGGIYRIKSNKITYDEKTGYLSCDSWGKGKSFGAKETPAQSANITESRMNYLSLVEGMEYREDGNDSGMHIDSPKPIFKNSTARIDDKGDYYEIYVEVDSAFADNDPETIYFFEKDNGAKGVHIEKCNITYQIWKCGLPKAYVVDETWSGHIAVYDGEANAKTKCKYSYEDKDCTDDSATEAILNALLAA